MSVIYTGEFCEGSGEYEVLCQECKRVVGRATRAELSEMTVTETEVMCFSCEGFWSDKVPDHLMPKPWEIVFVFCPERTLMLVDRPMTIVENLAKRAREDAVLCLSSSPYLPRVDHNKQARTSDGVRK